MNGSRTTTQMNGSRILMWGLIFTLVLLVVAGGYFMYWVPTNSNIDPEIIMGILVVFSIATLMTVIFIMTAGFSAVGLANNTQALGLPEGSIRAMIALVLIMVFIIFGIFLFRKVSLKDMNYLAKVVEVSDFTIPSDTKTSFLFEAIPPDKKYDQTDPEKNPEKRRRTEPNNYYVYAVEEASEDGKRLAQQLITTVGTLVVAIASFYFGTTTANSAAKKERENIMAARAETVISNPEIKDITPKVGRKDEEIVMRIVGSAFKAPMTVRLLRGSEEMVGRGVSSTATEIQCRVKIDKEPDGKWDVMVSDEDGKQARLDGIFVIT